MSVKKYNVLSKNDFESSNVELKPNQQIFNKKIRNNVLTCAWGPAGTSKTFTSCYTALQLLANRKVEEIIITKPIQESGESMGYLPGSIAEKSDPFMQSYFSNFIKIIGREKFEQLRKEDIIKVELLAYMRGATYDNCVMLLDEAQNCTLKQIMLWVTRLGKDSKAILTGDTSQYDIKESETGFGTFLHLMDGVSEYTTHEFNNEDIVRNKFLIEVTKRYDKFKRNGNII